MQVASGGEVASTGYSNAASYAKYKMKHFFIFTRKYNTSALVINR